MGRVIEIRGDMLRTVLIESEARPIFIIPFFFTHFHYFHNISPRISISRPIFIIPYFVTYFHYFQHIPTFLHIPIFNAFPNSYKFPFSMHSHTPICSHFQCIPIFLHIPIFNAFPYSCIFLFSTHSHIPNILLGSSRSTLFFWVQMPCSASCMSADRQCRCIYTPWSILLRSYTALMHSWSAHISAQQWKNRAIAEHACSKMKIVFHKNEMRPMIRSSGTIFFSLVYFNPERGYSRLKYMYTVISVKIDSLPANTKIRESTSSWTARVRCLASCVDAAPSAWVQSCTHDLHS